MTAPRHTRAGFPIVIIAAVIHLTGYITWFLLFAYWLDTKGTP